MRALVQRGSSGGPPESTGLPEELHLPSLPVALAPDRANKAQGGPNDTLTQRAQNDTRMSACGHGRLGYRGPEPRIASSFAACPVARNHSRPGHELEDK